MENKLEYDYDVILCKKCGMKYPKEIEENHKNFCNNFCKNCQSCPYCLKDIPIKRTDENEEIFSIEIKTESKGAITQSNTLPSKAIFDPICDYKCKTCDKDNVSLCLSCTDEFPFYYKDYGTISYYV